MSGGIVRAARGVVESAGYLRDAVRADLEHGERLRPTRYIPMVHHDLDRAIGTPLRWWALRKLPRPVVYWVALLAVADGTRLDETAPAVPAMDIVARWGPEPGRSAAWERPHREVVAP